MLFYFDNRNIFISLHKQLINKQNHEKMKKVLLSLSVIAGLAFTSNAQHCGAVSSCIPAPVDTPDLIPHTADLPCFNQGAAVNEVLTFRNYTKFDNVLTPTPGDSLTVDKLVFTSIELPDGLCWKMATADNSVLGGALGCIQIEGTPTAAPGQYKLAIAFDAFVNGSPIGVPQTSEDISLFYWVRITAPGSTDCPALDTVAGKTTAFIPYGSGINDINSNVSAVSVSPNPFGTAANVSFFTETKEAYTLKLTNILGAELHSETIVTKNGGTNTVTVENKNYANGVYLISLTNGKSTITKRVVIQQ